VVFITSVFRELISGYHNLAAIVNKMCGVKTHSGHYSDEIFDAIYPVSQWECDLNPIMCAPAEIASERSLIGISKISDGIRIRLN